MKPLEINLDLKINNYTELEMMQGYTYPLIATISDLGESVDLTGQVVSVEMLKADKTFIIQNNDISILNNKITINLNKDFTRVNGQGKLQIKLTKGTEITGSWVVNCNIRESAINQALGESGNIVTIKESLDNSILKAVQENAKTENLIAGGGAATKGQITEVSSQLAEKMNKTENKFQGAFLEKTLKKLYYTSEDVLIVFAGDSVTWRGNVGSGRENSSYTAYFCEWLKSEFPNSKIIRVDGNTSGEVGNPISDFVEKVIQEGTGRTITVVRSGRQADGIFQIQNRMEQILKYNNKTPDLISLMIGINDSDINNVRQYSTINIFEEVLNSVVGQMLMKTSDVMLMTPHWAGSTLKQDVSPYIEIVKNVGKSNNILTIDNKFIWDSHYKRLESNYGQGTWLNSGDNIHPSVTGQKDGLFNNIIENIFNVKSKKLIRNFITINDSELSYTGTWTDKIITDSNSRATYNYKKSGTTVGDFCSCNVFGNEIYMLVRKGIGQGMVNINSSDWDNYTINLSRVQTYPTEKLPVANTEMYSTQYCRVLIYKGDYLNTKVTLQANTGSFEIYGFECVSYLKSGDGSEIGGEISETLIPKTGKSISLGSPELQFYKLYLKSSFEIIDVANSKTLSVNGDRVKAITPLNFQGGTSGRMITVDSNASTLSGTDSTFSLGTSVNRFKDLYLTNAPNVSSKRELKDDIILFDNNKAYEGIKQLPVYTYKFKEVGEDGEFTGNLENEIMLGSIYEELPIECLNEENEGVDLYAYTTYCISALKKAIEKIENLEDKINILEGSN